MNGIRYNSMEEKMNKTRLTILPILSVFFALFFGWSTIFGQAAEKLENQFREIEALPSGAAFTLTVTDDDITAAANEYLARYLPEIEQMVQEATGIKLNFADPVIEFKTDYATASLRVGKGILKIPASLRADVYWDGTLHVEVKEIEVPVISVDPVSVNSAIQGPIRDAMASLEKYYEIRDLELAEGYIKLEAVKK